MFQNVLQCFYMDCRNYGYFTFTFARVWLVHYVANVTGTPVALDGVATQLLTWGRIAQALILHWLREEIPFWLLPRGFNNQFAPCWPWTWQVRLPYQFFHLEEYKHDIRTHFFCDTFVGAKTSLKTIINSPFFLQLYSKIPYLVPPFSREYKLFILDICRSAWNWNGMIIPNKIGIQKSIFLLPLKVITITTLLHQDQE